MSDAPRQQAPDDRAEDPRHAPQPDGVASSHAPRDTAADGDDPARHDAEVAADEPPVRPVDESSPTPADAIGPWPDAEHEAGAMPAERPHDEQEPAAAPAEEPPVEDHRTRDELLQALRDTEAQRDEYLDDVRRGRAEFENFRRRTMREGATQREAGKAEVLEGLLDVLDDLDRTLEAAETSTDEGLAKGVEMVAGKLVRSLQAAGLERVDATGTTFDPNQHEAVQQVESETDHDEPVVAQVLRPGYRLGDRVLRAAMVVVEQ